MSKGMKLLSIAKLAFERGACHAPHGDAEKAAALRKEALSRSLKDAVARKRYQQVDQALASSSTAAKGKSIAEAKRIHAEAAQAAGMSAAKAPKAGEAMLKARVGDKGRAMSALFKSLAR